MAPSSWMLCRNRSPIRKRSFHRDAVLVVRGGRGTNRRSSTSARVVFRASRCEMSDERQEEVDVVRRCEAEARVRLKQEQDTGRFPLGTNQRDWRRWQIIRQPTI